MEKRGKKRKDVGKKSWKIILCETLNFSLWFSVKENNQQKPTADS